MKVMRTCITEDWSIVASYGYTDTEDKANNPGDSLLNMSEHTASLFMTHRLEAIGLPHFIIDGGGGRGLRHTGEMYVVDPGNSVDMDDVTVCDLNITYQYGPWTAVLAVQNLTDQEYREIAFFRSAVATFGAPRYAFLSILYDF